MKFSFFCFAFAFLLCSPPAHAQFIPDSLDKKQTFALIDSICHSPDRRVKNIFSYEKTGQILSATTYLPALSEVEYRQFYQENGKLQRTGLYFHHEIGTWLYYDTSGVLFKEYDFTTKQRRLYGIDKEPMEAAFDSMKRVSERFLIRHYGADFYRKNMHLDPVHWETKRFMDYSAFPDFPRSPAKNYSIETEAVFNDSISGAGLRFEFDSTLRLVNLSGVYLEDTAAYYPKINFSYAYALRLARSKGFESVYLSEWDPKQKTFFWTGSVTLTEEGTVMNQRTTGKLILINAKTGKYSIRPFEGGYDADGFISDYQKPWKDTLKTLPGWKSISVDGFIIDVPRGWILVENYHYKTYEDSYVLVHGKDTLKMEKRCGIYMDNDWNRPEENKEKEKEFLMHFPERTVQGRTIDLKLLVCGEDRLRIQYNLVESGVPFNCGPIIYHFETGALDEKQVNEILDILKTVRFSTF